MRQSSVKAAEQVVSDGYRIDLADGSGLHLLTTRGTDSWIRRLAAIMRLERLRDVLSSEHMYPQVEKRGVLRLRSNGDGEVVISGIEQPECGELNPEVIWRSFYPFHAKLILKGGLPLHAALALGDGRAVVIAARAGEGKSTLCRRLPSTWHAVCDEEVVVVRVPDEGYRVHPFPTWSDIVERKCDRTWDVQRHYPLSAIFFLERGESDSAEPVGVGEAALYLSRRAREKCFFHDWDLDKAEEHAMRRKLFDNVCALAREMPAYRLTVSKTGRFWEEIEGALRRDGIMEKWNNGKMERWNSGKMEWWNESRRKQEKYQ